MAVCFRANRAREGREMKRISYHPHVHPAQPWCVCETDLPKSVDISRLPKVALFFTRDEAKAAHPDAIVDAELAWECQLRVTTDEG
jgi:hypothetical protein